MRRFGSYLFIRTLTSLTSVLMTLVGIAWVTQALRKFDLVTAKGQAVLLYLRVTLLALPQVVGIITPFALMLAMVIVLSQLRADSGLIAITAAGASQRQLAAPFVLVSVLVSLFVGAIVFWIGPSASRTVADIGGLIRADVVTNVIQPGRFTEVDDGITFHIRDRGGDGSLVDLFIYDSRNSEFTYTYSARHGRIADVLGRSMIVMEDGTVERTRKQDSSSTFVAFGSYAFDLSQLTLSPRSQRFVRGEQTLDQLMAGLADPTRLPFSRGEIVAEILNRLAQPLYPVALSLAVFLFLGFPSSNRRGQGAAVAGALLAGSLVELVSFAMVGISRAELDFALIALAAPLLLIVLFAALVVAGIEPMRAGAIGERIDAALERLARRLGRKPDEEAA